MQESKSVDDARWFRGKGYEERLRADVEGASMSYDRMALCIDGRQVDSRNETATSRQ
jgi:hypothetical protein